MKKSDLKTGMTVGLRDGRLYKVLRDVVTENYGHQDFVLASEKGGFNCGTEYLDDLLAVGVDACFDIVVVFQYPGTYNILEFDKSSVLWKRKEEKPMPEIVEGEIYVSEDEIYQGGIKWIAIFRATKQRRIETDFDYYSLLDTGGKLRTNDWLVALGPHRTCRTATPKEAAKLVKKEIKNGYYWNGKELVKI